MPATVSVPLTIGEVAERFGVRPWQVRKLFTSGRLPPAARVGPYRVIPEQDLPKVERALRQVGYLPESEAAHE
jgi:DNA-binding transcriptional MerR regulator